MHRDISPTDGRLIVFLLVIAGLFVSTSSPPLHASPAGHLFDTPLSHYVRGDPEAMVMGDFNNDGQMDAAMANRGGGLVVCLGDGHGRFSILGVDAAGYTKIGVAAGDLDGDGTLDLVASYYDWYDPYYGPESGGVSLCLGRGDGTFDGAGSVLQGNHLPGNLALGDLDGDNRPDLAVVLDSENAVAVLMGQGDGAFSVPVFHATGNDPTELGLADLEGDGDTDLVVVNHRGDSVSVLLNNGDGSFAAAVAYPAGYRPWAMAVADLDQAGGPDLVVTNLYSGTISVLFGDGSGAFSPPVSFPVGGYPGAVTTGDLDGDGYLDLAVGTGGSPPALQLLFNDGSGGFTTGSARMAVPSASDLAIRDLDGDGDSDIFLAANGIHYLTGSDGHTYWGDSFGRCTVLLNHGGGEFPTPGSRTVGNGPVSLALGDLSEDGFADLVAVDGSQFLVLPGNGDTTFGAPVGYGGVSGPEGVVLGDLNGDSHLDAAVVSWAATSIYLGSGEGTLALSGSVDAGGGAIHMADLDLDGDPDLVVVGWGVRLLLGNGDGSFQLGDFVIEDPEHWALEASVGPLDNDNVPDLVLRYMWTDYTYAFSATEVWIGNADGTFTQGNTYQVGGYSGPVHLHDLDLDGHLDLLLADRVTSIISEVGLGVWGHIRWGHGDGTFPDGSDHTFVTGVEPTAIHVDDLNGDGLPDLAVTNAESRNVAVLLNNGDRSFVEGISQTCGDGPQCLDTADLDGDGDLELVTGNTGSNDVSVLLNLSQFPFLATGPGIGEMNPPLVRLFDLSSDCAMRRQWQAYGVSKYGVNVACADLDGDGRPEILTGPGPGEMFGPHVRGFQASGDQLPGISFLAYGTHRYGVNVAGADLDGDGRQDIVTGAGPGAVFGPHVRGWAWDGSVVTPIPGISYFAYGTPKWGVNVSGGDIDGDGFDEIITGAGPGDVYGPHVRGWNWDGGGPISSIGQVSFFAYGTHRKGVNVCAGDIDGDGIDEIVTGAGPSGWFSPNVRGWNWDGAGAVTMIPGLDFIAYNSARWGVNVSCGDLDGDGVDEIVTGRGPGSTFPARVRGWRYDGAAVVPMPDADFTAYDPAVTLHGVKVAAGR